MRANNLTNNMGSNTVINCCCKIVQPERNNNDGNKLAQFECTRRECMRGNCCWLDIQITFQFCYLLKYIVFLLLLILISPVFDIVIFCCFLYIFYIVICMILLYCLIHWFYIFKFSGILLPQATYLPAYPRNFSKYPQQMVSSFLEGTGRHDECI